MCLTMDKFNYIILLVCSIHLVYGDLRILELKVPSTIESGSNDEVILDCDFEFKNEVGLVMKWFHNMESLVYQWIPNANKPQALGFLKDRVDLDFTVSNDSNTMHRALRIRNITPDLSGDYTCKVSTVENEVTATKRMIIYEPAKEFDFVHIRDEHTVICSASGVYPEPKMKVYMMGANKNATKLDIPDSEEDVDGDENDNGIPDDKEENLESSEDNDSLEVNDDGRYNISSILTYNIDDLTEVSVFVCDLWIPDTTYRLTKKLDYYTDSAALTLGNTVMQLVAVTMSTMHWFF